MYLKLSSVVMSDLTALRGGTSVAIVGQVWDNNRGYVDVVDAEEVVDVIITKVKELCDENKV